MLDDGMHAYLYGNMRLAQQSATNTEYFLTDALGSVRQTVDETEEASHPYGELTLAQAYLPYGEMLSSVGSGATSYGFTGKTTDGLVWPGEDRELGIGILRGIVVTTLAQLLGDFGVLDLAIRTAPDFGVSLSPTGDAEADDPG